MQGVDIKPLQGGVRGGVPYVNFRGGPHKRGGVFGGKNPLTPPKLKRGGVFGVFGGPKTPFHPPIKRRAPLFWIPGRFFPKYGVPPNV